MMPAPLSPDQLAHVYRNWVRPAYISAENPGIPTVVLLGGQPGGGLSAAAAQVLRSHPGMYEISATDLRRFHPAAVALSGAGSRSANDELRHASALWARALQHDSKTAKQSILLRGGFTDPDATMQLARDYAEAGYIVEVVAVATPRRDSLINALGAPLNALDDNLALPTTSLSKHDSAYDGTRDMLRQVHLEPAISRLSIIDRAGEYTHDRHLPESLEDAHIALDSVRTRPMTAHEAKVWLPELRRIDDHVTRTNGVNTATLPYLRELHQIAETEAIPALGLTPDSPARALLEARNRQDLADLTTQATPTAAGPHEPHRGPDEINSSLGR